MTEEWRDIAGYEGLYQISNLGRVKSLPRTIRYGWGYNKVVVQQEMIRKSTQKKNGYWFITLKKDNKQKQFLIHRLVAEAFLENKNNYQWVNHKDENPSNNCVTNLEWCTPKYNANYGDRNKKISLANRGKKHYKSKTVMCVETGIIYASTGEAERETGIKSYNIRKCANGTTKNPNGYHWKYVNLKGEN